MPCYDSRADDDAKANVEKVHKLTRMLCTMCRLAEGEGHMIHDFEVLEWWREHKKDDQKREQNESK